ncbi:hypothetical protein OG890_28165 [Streptomyces anulatus]|uniref:hypothetical protein n=1 Tax=Streptomyces anulatus TaxID=1892 RepID=UPI0022548214|nr:hypothetical protein [Streptomyces anulatus]MCX4487764.1 hypothetical protein [Streptomyces anulatus]WSU77114.1 hypothetical protein OG499_31030 [Streptomyces anulatus]
MGTGEGGEQKLASSASDKKRAASYMREHLMPDTRSAGSMAAGGGSVRVPFLAPSAAPPSPLMKQDTGLKGLVGWASDQGVSDALVSWQAQVNRLVGRLQQELNGLEGAKTIFHNQDLATGAQLNSIRPPSSFDGM